MAVCCAGMLHPSISEAIRRRMVTFLSQLHHSANVVKSFATAGGPWDFNLRDLLRWCQLAASSVPHHAGTDRDHIDKVRFVHAPFLCWSQNWPFAANCMQMLGFDAIASKANHLQIIYLRID